MKTLRTALIFTIASLVTCLLQGQVIYNSIPSRIVGQSLLQQQGILTATAPNLVEGHELWNPQSIALDTSSTPSILYVADTSNNRVLAWRNASGFTKGDFADKVIGQRDLYSTSPKGPGSDLSSGLSAPVGLAVDKNGNLYVIDAGNNRIVRYPAPFSQTGELLAIDLLIGQRDNTGRSANEGLSAASEKTLAFLSGSSTYQASLAFDSQGNLWVSDPGNNRVLRFPVAALTAGNNEPSADLVLGQVDFSTSKLPASPARNGKNFLSAPSGIAFDPQGRLYVADGANRVSVFTPPFSTGQLAARLMGIILPTQAAPTPPAINENTLGSASGPPSAIFFVGNNPFVVDTGNARILKYDPFDQWPAEATQFSPKAIAVLGQPDYITNRSNQGQPQPSESSFSGPIGAHTLFEGAGVVSAVFSGNDLYVADAGNNRVLVFPQQSGGTFRSATRLLGQVGFNYNAPNLIEGRELFLAQSGGGVVVDTTSDPPHLYVSDPGNNRVLGYLDYRKVRPGVTADLVIGQPDFYTAMINYPKNDRNLPNDQGLSSPEGLAVDKNGNLWVADSGNSRVLRFPKPFDQPAGTPRAAVVLGQANFFQKITDASSQTMKAPYGVTLTADGHLLASDASFNRILFFRRPGNGDFASGQSATSVIGQPDFGPPTATSLSSPRLIAVDTDDRLYVADSGNNRIAIYRNVPTAGNDPAPSFSLTGLSSPYGVFVSADTGEIWVADSGSNHVYRYPRFDTLVLTPAATVSIPSFGPLAIGLDSFGNPIVAESFNRVAFYYPSIDNSSSAGGVAGRFSGNGANYFQRFAPGMLASIFAYPSTHFGLDTAQASTVPLPTTLGDVQVIVGGVAAPLLYVSASQINFQVPSATPVGSAPAEFQVVKASTGQILSSGFFRIEPVSPGLFTSDASGSGQLAVLNQDNSVNSPGKPAKAGTIISLFGTGIGAVSGGPADGTPAPNQPLSTDEKPQVYINGVLVPDSDVTYSGLAPGFIGLWQINVKVPATVPTPDRAVPVAVVYKGINSRADQFGNGRTTTIRTTP